MFGAAARLEQKKSGAGRDQQDRTKPSESAHARPYCLLIWSRKSVLLAFFPLDPGLEAIFKQLTPALQRRRFFQTTKCRVGHLHYGRGFTPGRKRDVEKRCGRATERRRDGP